MSRISWPLSRPLVNRRQLSSAILSPRQAGPSLPVFLTHHLTSRIRAQYCQPYNLLSKNCVLHSILYRIWYYLCRTVFFFVWVWSL